VRANTSGGNGTEKTSSGTWDAQRERGGKNDYDPLKTDASGENSVPRDARGREEEGTLSPPPRKEKDTWEQPTGPARAKTEYMQKTFKHSKNYWEDTNKGGDQREVTSSTNK